MTDPLGPDEPILSLRDLAAVDSPEVVRSALRRFRRRVLVRGLVVVAVIAGLVFVRDWSDHDYLPRDYGAAFGETIGRTIREGRVTATIMDAKRVEQEDGERYAIRLIVKADGLRKGERLHVESALSACFPDVDAFEAGPTAGDTWSLVDGRTFVEVLASSAVGYEALGITVGAVSELGDRSPQPYPTYPEPLACDSFLVSDPEATYVRYLATFDLRPRKVGIADEIWRGSDGRGSDE